MSDFDSRASTPADNGSKLSKRRRRVYDDSEASTPRDTSPDELADHKPHRSSRINIRPESSLRRRARSASSDGSVDELDHTYHARSQSRSRRGTPSRSRSRSSSRASHRSSQYTPSPPPPPVYQPLKLNYKTKYALQGHTKGVSQVRFSPDGRWIASCSADGTIKIWEAATGRHMRTLEGHLAGISTIAWSPDSNTIASGSDDKLIRLWDRATGKPYPVPLSGHHNYVYSLAFSPKGNILVSGSFDEAVVLWDLRGRKQMRNLPAHSDPVGGVDFVRDGTLICSCSTDGLIRVWDTATGQCLRTIVHEDNAPVTTLRFSPNGRYILAHTLDSCIRLWDYVSGSCKKTYQGHTNKKYSLGGAFGVSGSQSFIVSGSEDGDILFWDVTTKEVVQRVRGHDGPVCWVDTSPGPTRSIVSGGLDGIVKIWVDPEQYEEGLAGMDGLKIEHNSEDTRDIKLEDYDSPEEVNITNGEPRLSPEGGMSRSQSHSPDRMDEE